MKNFDWNGFKDGIFEVECVTEKDMVHFLEKCEERGYLWCSGDKPTVKNYYEGTPLYFDGQGGKLTYEEDNNIDYMTWGIEETEESTTQKKMVQLA